MPNIAVRSCGARVRTAEFLLMEVLMGLKTYIITLVHAPVFHFFLLPPHFHLQYTHNVCVCLSHVLMRQFQPTRDHTDNVVILQNQAANSIFKTRIRVLKQKPISPSTVQHS